MSRPVPISAPATTAASRRAVRRLTRRDVSEPSSMLWFAPTLNSSLRIAPSEPAESGEHNRHPRTTLFLDGLYARLSSSASWLCMTSSFRARLWRSARASSSSTLIRSRSVLALSRS